MSFQVLPCELQDLPTCSSIHWSVCAANPLWQIQFPHGGTPDLRNRTTYHMQCELEMPDMYFFKAAETSTSDKKVIGFAKWTVENGNLVTDKDGKEEIAQEAEKTTSNSSINPSEVREEVSNEAFFNYWLPNFIEIRHKHLTGKQIVMLDDLCVWPNHQRQGAGTLLLKKALNFADDRRLPCYLESTPLAQKMYTRQGFQHIDTVEIDLQQWKQGYEVYRTAILYREAQEVTELRTEQDLFGKAMTR